jgi:hypothetical protein
MSRKLLVTISEDASFLHGVRFVCHFFVPAADLQLDVVLMPPTTSPQVLNDPMLQETVQLSEKMFRDKGFQVGVPDAAVVSTPCLSMVDLARMAALGQYDAVVLGRRGAVRLVEYLTGQYKEAVFDENLDFPFWVCRTPDLTRDNILLCVDGSTQGLCAADHVGFMCQNEQRHSICVAYLADPQHRDKRDEDLIIENALKMLKVNNISESRIFVKVLAEQDHVQGIMREAEQGRFAVVAVGRAGTGRGMMTQRQFGSVCLRLARTLSRANLWVGGYSKTCK